MLTRPAGQDRPRPPASAPVQAILFSGIQATGKSSFYRERFFHTHVRINLDMLRTLEGLCSPPLEQTLLNDLGIDSTRHPEPIELIW